MTAAGAAVLAVVAFSGCGGGGGSGPPKNLSLQGIKIPTSRLTQQVTSLCAVARQAHTDPAGANGAFYGAGPHDTLHLLAAILAGGHHTQSQALLDTMMTFENDLAARPPPSATGPDADALVASANVGLQSLKVPPQRCG